MKYLIGEGKYVQTGEHNQLEQGQIDRALLALSGFRSVLVEGYEVWVNGYSRLWLPDDEDTDEIASINAVLNAEGISPALSPAFAQSLLRLVPMLIAPVVTNCGQLVGEWHVENNPPPGAGDIMSNGHQIHTYQHPSLPLAVAIVFLQTRGIGQQAWIYLGEHESADPELHYVMPQVEDLAGLAAAAAFIRAENLDEYAAIGVPPDVLSDAFSMAKLKRIATSTKS